MKYKVKKCDDNIAVPRDAVMSALDDADSIKFKVLFLVLNEPDYNADDICDRLDITKRRLGIVLSFWEKAGVLVGDSTKKKTEAKPVKKLMRASEMPKYTTDEVAKYVEKHKGFNALRANCENYIGKFFNVAETEILIGMREYLNLDEAYIDLLFAYCAKMDKKSLRYIEKMAIGLVDDGVLSFEELDAHLQRLEASQKTETKLRSMFGIGGRSLVKKEKEAFFRWSGEWKLPIDVIERAFEVTVENTGGASVPYCNAVLERWHESGYTTLEEVERALEAYRHDKNNAKDKKGSFETDDFFEAALLRSYGEK